MSKLKRHITEDTKKEDLVSFRMKAPCKDCPFRSDIPDLKGWLGRERAQGIAFDTFRMGHSFPCHKTVDHDQEEKYDEDGNEIYTYKPTGCESQCSGASIMQIKTGYTSAWMQISERLGFTAEVEARNNLDLNAPVFETVEDFINFHANDDIPLNLQPDWKKGNNR